MSNLGKRIIVIGISASGKSTFSRKLSKKLKLPLTLMDEIMWEPEWNYIGDEAILNKLKKISLDDQWIIEGYISKEAKGFLFERANKIIYLDYHPFVGAFRYIRRWWKHRKKPRPELKGSPETFSFEFLKLVWTKGEASSLNKFVEEVKPTSKVIRFTNPREAEDFIQQISNLT